MYDAPTKKKAPKAAEELMDFLEERYPEAMDILDNAKDDITSGNGLSETTSKHGSTRGRGGEYVTGSEFTAVLEVDFCKTLRNRNSSPVILTHKESDPLYSPSERKPAASRNTGSRT